MSFKLCPDCKQPNTGRNWCQNCNSKRFQKDFNKWNSGNELIDNFIQDAQLKLRNNDQVIEWIPYNRFRDIQYLAQGGFSTIYKAVWLDGCINEWDREKQQWKRDIRKLNKNKEYEIAKQVGVTVGWIGRIERGIHLPNIKLLVKIARALQVKIKDLIPNELV